PFFAPLLPFIVVGAVQAVSVTQLLDPLLTFLGREFPGSIQEFLAIGTVGRGSRLVLSTLCRDSRDENGGGESKQLKRCQDLLSALCGAGGNQWRPHFQRDVPDRNSVTEPRRREFQPRMHTNRHE